MIGFGNESGMHKHQPKVVVTLADTLIEVCVVCLRRRAVFLESGQGKYSKWFTREEANKDIYSWLWTGASRPR